MIRLSKLFLVLLLSVLLGIQLHHDPGYLLITVNDWRIESSLWFTLIIIMFTFILVHKALVLIARLSGSPAKIRHWQINRRTQKSRSITRQSFIEFSEGYWSKAKDHLVQALDDTDNPLFNYLTAARAAQEMGNNQLRDGYLREAQQSIPDAKIAIGLTQAQLQLASKQWEQARATLKHLQEHSPKHPYVLKLLINLYEEVKDWQQLIALLPELKKNKILTSDAFAKLQERSYLEAISILAKQAEPKALSKIIHDLPKNLKLHPTLMSMYAEFLINNNKHKQAEMIVRDCLKKQFDSQLIELYGRIKSDENQLIFAESLIKKYPHSAELYLCLGRLSLDNHLWGKAKSYFEQSINLRENSDSYEELGRLFERLNEQAKACEAYRRGLALRKS